MLEISNLSKSFKKYEVLKEISISLENGVYGLLGSNGAGKTTLIRCITNIYNINKGNIKFKGKDVYNNNELLKNIGYLPQKFGLFKEITVYENLQYFCILKGLSKKSIDFYITDCLKKVNLEDKINHKVSTLSGGMIRRLGIAQAIIGDPQIIIFDEPTAGLDPEERIRFKNILSYIKKDKLIIISTHIVEDVEACCDKIIIMNDGKILKTGSTEEIEFVAKGKVFEVKAGNDSKTDWYVEKTFSRNGETFLRVLSNKVEKYESLEPTIEDGYMCILKGI